MKEGNFFRRSRGRLGAHKKLKFVTNRNVSEKCLLTSLAYSLLIWQTADMKTRGMT
jgi:hypothetical protein